jgi:pimeloyl-ACP methyl ester carboxylesterase
MKVGFLERVFPMTDRDRKEKKSRMWVWIIGAVLLVILGWNLFTNVFREEEKELRSQLRETVKEKFSDQNDAFSRTFGLFPVEPRYENTGGKGQQRETIVLIHGLDDPGKVWRNLAPALIEQNYGVWLMTYPNDQPVVESARLFFEELKQRHDQADQPISIVAHSMGGLVSREMLSNPDIHYQQAVNDKLAPAVERLIMVGTPNHGSQLARFRIFAELRDHLTRLVKGEAAWLGAIFDGAGEAKIDLLPGSRFLTELNARPYPQGVNQLIIAGVMSPWTERDVNDWREQMNPKILDLREDQIDALSEHLISMADGLGDGLVTVESTRLEGVPHLTVEGTHLSMIRNLMKNSRRIPPAVPIVIDVVNAE